jgi:hypothetical protein
VSYFIVSSSQVYASIYFITHPCLLSLEHPLHKLFVLIVKSHWGLLLCFGNVKHYHKSLGKLKATYLVSSYDFISLMSCWFLLLLSYCLCATHESVSSSSTLSNISSFPNAAPDSGASYSYTYCMPVF